LTFLTKISFDTRDICEEVIKKFNNTPVIKPGAEEHLIQIRYSDTHEQKMLKQQTAAGRVFRAAEYEVGVAQARGLNAGPERFVTMSPDSQGQTNEFEVFLQQGVAYVSASDPHALLPLTIAETIHRMCRPQTATASHGRQPCHPLLACLAQPCNQWYPLLWHTSPKTADLTTVLMPKPTQLHQ